MKTAKRKKMELQAKLMQGQINHQLHLARNDAVVDTMYLLLWALKTRQGYGTKRLKKVYEDILFVSECINQKGTGLTIDDIKQSLLEENNIVIH